MFILSDHGECVDVFSEEKGIGHCHCGEREWNGGADLPEYDEAVGSGYWVCVDGEMYGVYCAV